jgi:hypothetical protein
MLGIVVVEKLTALRPVTVAVAVFVPVLDPVVNFAAAFPLASVVAVGGVMVPPPALTAKATFTPGFPLPRASVTWMRTESENVAPTTTLVGSVPILTMLFAGPATLVAEKLTGDPTRAATVAVAVFAPTVLPILKAVPASPDASVVALVGDTEPPPAVAAKVTATPETGLPNESVTFTLTVLELPAAGDAGRSADFATVFAAPAETVITAAGEVTVPTLAVTFAVPAGPSAVTRPAELTVAILVAELL